MKFFAKIFPLLSIAFFMNACGSENHPSSTVLSEADRIKLASSDSSQFKNLKPDGGIAVDQKYPMAFTNIFGGTDAASVQKYFDDRVHHLVDSTKISVLSNGKVLDLSSEKTDLPTDKTAALNMSQSLWLMSLANGTEIDVKDADGTLIKVDSTRVGVISFGAAYQNTITATSGKTYPEPVEARQATLLHEARHSDCTGGMNADLLKKIVETSDDDLDTVLPVISCGHTHQKCISGDYQGFRACDGEAFGAYTIGALYALAGETRALKENNQVDYEILQAAYVDYLSRVQGIDEENILSNPGSPKPDMSSDGFHP